MRRVLVVIGSMLALLFVSQNLDTVEISLVLGRPIEAPLALVIAAAFFIGFVAGVGMIVERRFRRNRIAAKEEDQELLE